MFGMGWQDVNSEAPAEKRARLDSIDFQGTEGGMPNQVTREEFPRNIRLPPHGRSVEGAERWTETHPSQTLRVHPGCPPSAPWSQADTEYDEDMYNIGTRTHNWQHGNYNASHWQDEGMAFNVRRGGPWRGKTPLGRPNAPRSRYPRDRGHIMDPVYIDRDGYAVQHIERRDMYEEGDMHGYGRAPPPYGSKQQGRGSAPALSPTIPNTPPAYPLSVRGTAQPPAHGKDRQTAPTPNYVEDVYSFEYQDSSATKSTPHVDENAYIPWSAKPAVSPKNRHRNLQQFYEVEEADRIARGQKPFLVECNSEGQPIETGGAGSKFVEVFRALCSVFLDVSIIKVRDQNAEAYARLREAIDSEFEYVGHPISDVGFKEAVSRCMKGERSRLHKLYTSRPDRDCPPKEQADVWERLKSYWKSPEFGKVKKVGPVASQTATTPKGVAVNTAPCSILYFHTNSSNSWLAIRGLTSAICR